MTESASQYVALLKEVFDPKGRGYVDLAEVDALLMANGYADERAAVLELLSFLKADESGRVSLKNARSLFEPAFVSLSEPSNIALMFASYDVDCDNYISASDLASASEELGFVIEPQQSQEMVAKYDLDGDRRLSLEEFSRIFSE
jgi:Ca2+-binding EF-hand superfamily protein